MLRSLFSILMISTACGLISSCDSIPPKNADDYKNEAVQNVEIGEMVKIYYTTNSCCGYCSPAKEALNHLIFIGEEIIIPPPYDCDGCSSTKALLFRAKSVGTDTIQGRIFSRDEGCSDTLESFESYIIHVQ